MSKNRREGFKVVRTGHRVGGCKGPCRVCDGFKVDRSLLSAREQEKDFKVDSVLKDEI